MSQVFIHPSAVVDEGAELGEGTKVWHFSHVMGGARIGRNCSLGQNVFVADRVSIGDSCRIQNNVSVYEGVELEDLVFCGPSAVFTNVKNPRAGVEVANEDYAPTLVRRGATIGANATIVCGTTIGEWAFIGAGAVVAADVPAHALMTGVPAKCTGWACECGEVLPEDLRCGSCSRAYSETPSGELVEG